MWILENEGEAFDGRRLWLRPGQRYLFGRTCAEPGQLAIKGPGADKVSRKHVTIRVDAVGEGDAENMGSRSQVTVEDLGSKGGTKVNDHKYKGESCVLSEVSNTLQMGSYPKKFRITWFPVVLSFSYTRNQLRGNPLARLRQSLEQLDVKLLAEYDVQLTTHVVSKKRNTSKGLQALINGRHIVNDGFVDAIVTAATPQELSDGVTTSPLEDDFDANWPEALQFLPPPGEELVPRPPEAFAPNPARAELFDGYTFIFYEKKQYESLLGPITNGRGKALFEEAVAEETQIDDFVRYVKGVAGEKGLGEFEDGSEGKGVVVVKWMPSSPEHADWFAEFFRSISLRLDHRLIDQKEFLDAILNSDASGLRRPLEFETQPPSSPTEPRPSAEQQAMDLDEAEPAAQAPAPASAPARRKRRREPVKSRFRGFGASMVDSDSDDDVQASAPAPAAATQPAPIAESSQEGLFVTQEVAEEEVEEPAPAGGRSQRKRPAPPPEPESVMDDFAPTAAQVKRRRQLQAQVKRRRIAAGAEFVPRRKTPPTTTSANTQNIKAKPVKARKEIDILDQARQHREQAEKRAREERENLEAEPGDLDLAQIRRLQIVESIELRPAPPTRTREQDIEDGRWDPSWNGRKNFKKFRLRGAVQGRAPEKIIVELEPVRSKGFGIGGGYWLEDGSTSQQQQKKPSQTQTQSQGTNGHAAKESSSNKKQSQRRIEGLPPVDSSDEAGGMVDEDEDDDDVIIASASRSRTSRASANTTQSQLQSGRTSTSTSTSQKTQPPSRTVKRAAAAPPAREQPAKRSRVVSLAASDDDSDDGLTFRFGKR
ncbi:Uu.00g030120.m01.CDS01 [Anthostomella pinea]|uniref:Uu.00g030120.m01.CDS01 n=1 Tax=Anthostomella pinea TaxID=933095 RepID=A0AAI8YAJ5_9PEZI|nr:Uu.00g030120.m01.CDS01 [Anthostomella pinea]